MRKLVFLGNCQAFRYKEMYRECYARHLDDQVEFVPSFSEPTGEAKLLLADADVIALQVFDQPQACGLHNVETAAEIIAFPTISGMFLWPTGGTPHPSNKPESYLPAGPYDLNMGDRILNAKIAAGPMTEERAQSVADEYLNLDLAKVAHAERVYELIIDRQRQRDAQSGFDCATIIESNFRQAWLFPTPAVFDITLFRHMAATLYDHLRVPAGLVAASLESLVVPPFPSTQRPIHPSVARCLGLSYVRPDQTYIFWTGEHLPIREYVIRYLLYRWNAPLLDAVIQAEQTSAESEPARLLTIADGLTHALATGFPNGRAQRALSDVRWRLGDESGAFAAYRSAMEIEPDDPHATGHYSFLLMRQGQSVDARALLGEAVTRWPKLASLWERLAHLLFGEGKLAEAIDVLGRATQQLPHNEGLAAMYRDLKSIHAAMPPATDNAECLQ